MAIFIYPSAKQAEVTDDIKRAELTCGTHLALNEKACLRTAAQLVLHHKVLLLPAKVEHHTEMVHSLHQVALLCGMTVQPITNYKRIRPAPAPAARHTQPSVGAGNS